MTNTQTISPEDLTPGAVFSTAFETGCIVTGPADEDGNFLALDSDGIECSYSVVMVAGIEAAR